MLKVYGYSKCSTVRKSLKFLDDHNIKYEHIDNVEHKLSYEELKNIYEKSGVEIKKLFNTSGIKYRELGLKNKLKTASTDEALKILATDGMLVKRPLVIGDDFVLIRFKENQWIEKLLSK